MKKILSLLLISIAILPITLLGGCKDSGADATNVRNKVYYVTSAKEKDVDITKTYTDANMKIIFYDDLFMVEFYDESHPQYGYYQGSFTISEDIITLTIGTNEDGTEMVGGTYENYKNNPEKNFSVFTTLKYKDGVLSTSFAKNNSLYSFTLKTK